MNHYLEDLKRFLNPLEGLEAKLDGIRQFKKKKQKPLREQFLAGQLGLEELTASLTKLADGILVVAFELARENLRPVWGTPRYRDNEGNYQGGESAIIGMGKLGGGELHFGSDLDVIFIFNRNGETTGGKTISNLEYFAKLAQRIIGYLTLYTGNGYAYKVDTELRPSGLAGALVTPIDSWTTYYHEMGQIWERQALLKARLIHATGEFSQAFDGLFRRLIFIKPFPPNLARIIHHLRVRIEKELAKESFHRWHFKKGYGGLVDIEFLVQYLQLKLGAIHEDLLTPNTLEAIQKLRRRGILSEEKANVLREAYVFYRNLEIHLDLHLKWVEAYLNPNNKNLIKVAQRMGFKSIPEFLDAFSGFRNRTRSLYLETLKVKEF